VTTSVPPIGDPPRDGLAPDFLLDLFRHPLDPGYAGAAARRAELGPRRPWRRRGAYALRVITLMVIGFLLAVAYREVVKAEPERARAHAGLVNEVKAAQAATDDLQNRSDQLRRQVSDAQAAALGSDAVELRRLHQEEAATGLAPVAGPGAVVRLADANPTIDPTTGKASEQDVSRVLDLDVQNVANALWASGAEAIAINGQRLTGLSTIRTAGSAILVDFRPVTSPYEVSAIGGPDLLPTFNRSVAAATMRQLVTAYGLSFSTRTEGNLRLPAGPGPPLRYATPEAPR
jgi:uncharacterized protein YlxW (UPF0749 family)